MHIYYVELTLSVKRCSVFGHNTIHTIANMYNYVLARRLAILADFLILKIRKH